MPPIVRAAQPTNSGTATAATFSPARPASVVTDDLLLYIVASSTTTAPTRPGTVTGVRGIQDTAFHLDVCRQQYAGQVAPSWSKTTACKWAGICLAIMAGTWDTVTPFDAENGAAEASASAVALHTTPSITILTDDCLLVAGFGTNLGATWTTADTNPAMLEAGDTAASATSPASAALYHSGTNAAPLGAITRSATASGTSVNAGMWIAAVRPGASSGIVLPRWARGIPAGERNIRPAIQHSDYR